MKAFTIILTATGTALGLIMTIGYAIVHQDLIMIIIGFVVFLGFGLILKNELKDIKYSSFKCRTCSYEENAYKRMDSLVNYCDNKLAVHYNPSKFPDSKPINQEFVKALEEARRDIKTLMIFH